MQIRSDRDSPLGHQGHLQEMPTGREIDLNKCILPKIGIEMGHFGKKLKLKNTQATLEPSKTQAMKLKYGHFHSN